MKRLRGRDAFTVYCETTNSPFVTLKVGIYRQANPASSVDALAVESFVKEHMSLTGGRRAGLRIIRVPFDLHHPVWVYDPDFSPNNHIFRATLPEPGGKKELCNFLSTLMSKPLNYDRPLWEIWIVDGLQNGEIAIVFKAHHALADGKMMAEFIQKTHADSAQGRSTDFNYQGEPIPGKLKLLGDAVLDLVKSFTIELPHVYRHYKRLRLANRDLPNVESPVKPFTAPVTVLDGMGGCEREYWYETFSLADFKFIAKQLNCTINDLILAITSEGLKRYLKDLGCLPDKSLITTMPVAERQDIDLRVMLNSDILNNDKVSIALVPLHQNIDDFSERVHAISKSSKAAIQHVHATQGKRLENYFDFMPGFVVRALNRLVFARTVTKGNAAYANLVISNVPGPHEKLFALDGRMELVELLSTGNLSDGGHLNITVWSYVDKITISFYMRKDSVKESEKLTFHFRNFVHELRQAFHCNEPQPQERAS